VARWRLDLEYDGTEFCGWQAQGEQRTVQRVLEAALARVFGATSRPVAAGRTDSGVHAAHQVVAFDTEAERAERGVVLGLNGELPADLAVRSAYRVGGDFDPRRAPHGKRYIYRWWVHPARSPLRRRSTWHQPAGLDVEAMALAAAALPGTHDFSAFRSAGCSAATAVRTVQGARVVRVGDEVHLVVEGTGFLRHMIRIIAGTLTDVGRGRRPARCVTDALRAARRDEAGPTAPALGLTLERVWYAGEPDAPDWAGFRDRRADDR
jgi:tRNA pseudouridine38-40 synthase